MVNEWYSWNPSPRTNPDIKVLPTLDKSNFPMGVKNMLNGGDSPVAWTNTKYRMVYLNYGPGDRIYTSPILTTMIDNSVAVERGAVKGNKFPKNPNSRSLFLLYGPGGMQRNGECRRDKARVSYSAETR